MSTIINTAYTRALTQLLKNASPHGILASRPANAIGEKPSYDYLFPRDTAICVLGMLLSENTELLELARISLDELTRSQSGKGQFPHSYRLDSNRSEWWHPMSMDSTLWWSIGVLKYVEKTGDYAFLDKHRERLEKAFTWLIYQDTNNDYLLEQGEAAGWDDEMPRQGTVLYTNALWYWLVRLRIEVEGKKDLEDLKHKIYEGVNTFLWVHKCDDHTGNYVPENNYTKNNYFSFRIMEWINAQVVNLPYYLGYVSHLSYEMRFDTFGNLLACISGLADTHKQKHITDFIFRSGVNKPFPVKVLYPPIYPGEDDWRPYMAKGRQNYPWQYHNGGIWPFVGGFWVIWLGMSDHPLAKDELHHLAKANAHNNWEFNEYLHGQHGTPMGMTYQSWSMAMYIAAYNVVVHSKHI